MTRSKRIFAAFALVFALVLAYVVYDISTRTTFPGSRPSPEEPSRTTVQDSAAADTTQH